jgi:hypothetical protein
LVDWGDRSGAITVVTKRQARKATDRLIEEFGDFEETLTIVGKGFDNLETSDNIRCVGYLDRTSLLKEYNKHKVVYAIGDPDPFSNTIKEGINCGCNVVYSGSGSYCTWNWRQNCYRDDLKNIWDRGRIGSLPFPSKRITNYRAPTYIEQVDEVIQEFQKVCQN